MPGVPAEPAQGIWTYGDYLTLPDDGSRYEVIDGVLYVSAAPTPKHQRKLLRLVRHLSDYVDANRLGEMFIAPVDVMMPGAAPVQPDALFIASDNPAVVEDNIRGVPDLIVEVASPSTARFDRREKLDLYARAGVSEYWLAESGDAAIELLVLDSSSRSYRSLGVFATASRLPSLVLPGLPFTVTELLGE